MSPMHVVLVALLTAVGQTRETLPTTPSDMRATAAQLSNCVGVWRFAERQLTSEGKPGTGEGAGQVANGFTMAAEYLYGHAWVADHPGKDPPTYEHFGVQVESLADIKRVDLRVSLENKTLKLAPEILGATASVALSRSSCRS